MPQEFDKELALRELEKLQTRVDIVLKDLSYLRSKVEAEVRISSDELDITVKDIDQIVRIMSDRRDVGH